MEHQELDYDFNGDHSRDCQGVMGWDKEGRTGQYFGTIVISDRQWAIILWENEEDPDLCKSESIEVAVAKYVRADHL